MLFLFLFVGLLQGIQCSERLNIIEGDIVVDPATQAIMDGTAGTGYDAMTNRKWPNGEIPYVFDRSIGSTRVKVIEQAIAEYRKYTCIKWVPRSVQRNYVRFKIDIGCYSSLGMAGYRQDISLGRGCAHVGIAIHEMMHAVGFFHEQSRLDRDNYVTIKWENIRERMKFNFKKYNRGEADTLGEPYDLDSVMHYHSKAFSINNTKTIVATLDPDRTLGNKTGFSLIDIRQINKMYPCPERPVPTAFPSPASTKRWTTPDPSLCKDTQSNCKFWKGRGFCEKPGFQDLKKSCCKTCFLDN